jgi:urease accessory protein
MIRIGKRIPGGRGLAAALLRRAGVVELDWDVRSRSRFDATDSAGRSLAVFLPRGSVVRGGDVLVAEDGSLVRVVASPQAVLVARPSPGGSPFDLLRAAYHLGNRHVMLELRADHLKLEPDPVLAELLRSMGLSVDQTHEPFEPEGGAYASSQAAHAPHGHHHEQHDHAHHAHDVAHRHGG